MWQRYFGKILVYICVLFGLVLSPSAFAKSSNAGQDNLYLNLTLKTGVVKIKLLPNVAPKNVARLVELAKSGSYNGVAFHRVIDGFMAQTGDVKFGNMLSGYNKALVGQGGSNLPDLPLEASKLPFKRGVVAMARAQAPNSANSQFFICFADAPWLVNQYTIVGEVVDGMQFVDKIKKGSKELNGSVSNPDYILKAEIVE